MRRLICLALLLSVTIFVSGCVGKYGPFVTDISPDGKGGIVVEKSMLVVNNFTGDITVEDVTTKTIYINTDPTPDKE